MTNYTIKQRLDFLNNIDWVDPDDLKDVKSKGTLTIIIPNHIKHELNSYAKKHNTTVSQLIRKLVRDTLLDYHNTKC